MAIKLKRSENEEPEVYGNENFGIPKDYTKKQRFSTLKLIFYVIAVVAICVTGYKYYADTVDRFFPEITYDRTNQPLVYSTQENIILKTQNGRSYDVGESIVLPDLSDAVSSAAFGKSVFFLSYNESAGATDLCYYNVNSDSVVLDEGVSDFKVDADGKFVAYRKGKKLYFSDIKEKYFITGDADEYYLSDNNQAIIYFCDKGRTMYYCPTEKNATPELVDTEISKIVSERNNHTSVYYIKGSGLYFKKYENESELICENVTDAIMLGNSVYYTTTEEYECSVSDFFVDDVAKTDAELLPPDGTDFIKDVDGLNFFDEEAFLEASSEYKKKLMRDEIRESFETAPITTEGFSLFMYHDGEKGRVDTHLTSPYLSYNSSKSVLLYKKYDLFTPERMDISEIESKESAKEYIDNRLSEQFDVDMYLVKERKKPFIAFEDFPIKQTEISLDNKYLYCIENNTENGQGVLARYEIGASALKNRKKICDGVTDFAVDGSDSSAVIIFSHNQLSLYFDNTLTLLSENSYRDFFFVDGTLFFYDDYDHAKKSGTLCSVRNGKISVIATEVHDFKVRKYNAVSYIKNFHPVRNYGTLYIKEGNAVKRQDGFVTAIIN